MSYATAATGKKAGAKQGRKKSSDQTQACLCEAGERFCMISDAAYYRALSRGFSGGDPLQDWLTAEAEIDAMLMSGSARTGNPAGKLATQ